MADSLDTGTVPAFDLTLAVTNRAARSIVQLLSADAGDLLLEEADLRGEAESLLRSLFVSRDAYQFKIQNGGTAPLGDRLVNLWLAADGDSEGNRAVLTRMKNWPIVLIGTNSARSYGGNEFLLIDVTALPPWLMNDVADSLSGQVVLDWTDRYPAGMPTEVQSRINLLPARPLPRNRVKILLDDWERFLEITQRLAEAKCFSLTYTSRRLDPSGSEARFNVVIPSGFDERKVHNARGEEIHIQMAQSEVALNRAFAQARGEDYDEEASDSWSLGTLVRLNDKRLTVELDDEVVRQITRDQKAIPKKGTLHYKAIGELAQVRRLRWGLQSLRRGRARNSKLGDFLFDANEAGLPDRHAAIRLSHAGLLQQHLNEGQLQAAEGALNAPDFYLIQGPPGTGKTTVIAEICYQVAMRGGRTLVASQANLAVDHAMSRLVHDPSIRALRRGRAERVEEEGQPYLEDYVIGTWLGKVAEDCRSNLAARRVRVRELERLGDIGQYLETFQKAKAGYDRQVESRKNAVQQANQAYTAAANAFAALQQKQDWLGEVIAFLELLHKLTDSDLDALDAVPVSDPAAKTWHDVLPYDMVAGDMAALRVLEQALGTWTQDPVSTSTESALTLPQCRMFADYLQRSRAAIERATGILEQVAAAAREIDDLHKLCSAWYRVTECERPLLVRRTEQINAQAEARTRVASLKAQISHSEAEQQEIEALARDLPPLAGDLPDWLLKQALADNQMVNVPQAFRSGIRRTIWNTSIQPTDLGIDGLQDMVNQTQQLRNEAETLKHIVSEIDQSVRRLLTEVSPGALTIAQMNPPDWRTTNFRNMVTTGPDGVLHPVREAESLIQEPLEIMLRRCLSPDPKKSVSEQDIARNIVGFRRLAADLLESQKSLMRLAQNGAQALQISAQQIAKTVISKLKSTTDARVLELTTQLRNMRGELVTAEYELELTRAGDEQGDDGLRDLMRQKDSIAQKIKSGLTDETSRSILPLAKTAQLAYDALVKTEEVWKHDWQQGMYELDRSKACLAQVAAAVRPDEAIQTWLDMSQNSSAIADQRISILAAILGRVDARRRDAHESLQALERAYQAACATWVAACEMIPETERAEIGDVTSGVTLNRLPKQLAAWARERQELDSYLEANTEFISDWIKRIESRDKRDEADLHQIYIDSANVIGITCVQAGSRSFSDRYRDFDTVIIDEVSKATPPELLLPMLKGAKVVLVGDSRQLPPMVGPEALTDLAESLEVDWRDLGHLQRSLFRDVFERAPGDLKSWLTDQYRMHPQIMDAINQFYHDKLVCKIDDPDLSRAHGLEPLIPKSTHIAWIPTEWSGHFYESRVGTSRRNDAEVDIIENLVSKMNEVWGQGGNDRLPKEVGVITFYAAQEKALKARLLTPMGEQLYEHLDLRLGTVDRFQGMEKPVIIVSLVCNNSAGDIGFAKELERINVAFSRAEELLVIVGCRELFCRRARSADAVDRYSRVADVIRKNGGMLSVREFLTR